MSEEPAKTKTTEQPSEPSSPPPTPLPSIPQPKVPAVQTSRSNKKGIKALGVGLIAFVLVMLGVAGGLYIAQEFGPNATPSLTTTHDGNTAITETESSIASVAEKVGPSVVSIVTQTRAATLFGGTSTSEAAGTGIIISKNGYIMTNNHVVETARNVSVIDSEGELYENVEVIGRDPLNDIAFLKIKSDKTFTAAQLGSSATLRTGQQVVAIGNALGQYKNTVTSGIISGTGRPITASSSTGNTETLTDLIQTDASINPGNSGGPLVNMAGQVIGINTAIVEDANGIGFAIPINATKGILAGVLETGKVSRAFLGVSYITVTPDVAREYDLPVKAGAYVYTENDTDPIAKNGPADKAGIRKGDIITKVNNESIGAQGSLSSILGEYRPGNKVTLTFLRDGKEQTASLSLSEYTK